MVWIFCSTQDNNIVGIIDQIGYSMIYNRYVFIYMHSISFYIRMLTHIKNKFIRKKTSLVVSDPQSTKIYITINH